MFIIKLLKQGVMLFFFAHILQAQNSISGSIRSYDSSMLQNAYVYLLDTSLGTTTNINGNYIIKNIPNGSYTLIVSLLGYKTQEKKVRLYGEALTIDVILNEAINNLGVVTLNVEKSPKRLKQIPFKPEVLDADLIQVQSTPLINILGNLSGLRIRQQGGLGSEANIMVNGISGKGIQTFIDGIPLELLGTGFSINNISSNLVKRIEIYKGIVPVYFGADVLGGVINIVTQNRHDSYFESSYTLGSWNTHQLGIGVKRYLNSRKTNFLQVDGFFNYSDNDYWMDDVDVVVDKLLNTKKGRAKRFNDQYKSYLARLQYGFQNVTWADDFRIALNTSHINKQWQHGITAIQPWGEVTSQNRDINSFISWKKNLTDRPWSFNTTLGYNFTTSKFKDLAGKAYFWDGTSVPKLSKGETGFYTNGRTPDLNKNSFFARAQTSYKINDFHKGNFVSLFSNTQLKGTDQAGASSFGKDFYKNPQTFTESYVGVSLESKLFNKKITNVLSAKYYWLKSKVAGLKSNNSFDDYIQNNNTAFGYGNALKVKWFNNLSCYLAYEYTLRLPDGNELFGDGITISPNPLLIPEKNHNINIGMHSDLLNKKIQLDINTFYRATKNAIFLNAISRGLSSYFNLLETQGNGIEASIISKPLPQLSLFANTTWQKIALKKPDNYGQIAQRHIGSRIPNSPYLFSNFGSAYRFPNIIKKNSYLELSYSGNYVHEFFRSWESDAANDPNKAKTPTQTIHHASIGYVFPNDKYSVFAECRNLTNEKAYDNYKVQKPGRSFHLKLRIFIN